MAAGTKTGPVPLAARIGHCTALRRGADCPCEALHSPTDVAGYRTCACGHTQQTHALPDAARKVRPGSLTPVERPADLSLRPAAIAVAVDGLVAA